MSQHYIIKEIYVAKIVFYKRMISIYSITRERDGYICILLTISKAGFNDKHLTEAL